MKARAHVVLPVALALAALAIAGVARAEGTAAACVAAAEQGQKLQGEGQLVEAKERFLVCGRESCPKMIRQDCTRWEGEVVAALPSVVLGAKDSRGNDIAEVSVTIDGEPAVDELTGTPTPIDPGSHKFVFKREGATPMTMTVLVREGEKNRLVTAKWGGDGSSSSRDEGATARHDPNKDKVRSPGVTTAAYTLLGVGVVMGGLALYGLIAGESATSALQSPVGCAHTLGGCSASQINHAETLLWLGDITGPISLVSLGVATYLFVRAPDAPAPKHGSAASVSFELPSVGALPGGGLVSWAGRF